jgi:hypothetical protein
MVLRKKIGVINMNSKLLSFFISLLVCMTLLYATTNASGGDKKAKAVAKVTGSPQRTYLDINNISTQFYNNGSSDIDPSGNAGFVYPKGSGKTCVFQSGFLWGAMVPGDPQPRVGGSAYRQGIQGGRIVNGAAEDPNGASVRIYRVRPDVYPGGPVVDLSAAAANEGTDPASLRAQYEKDWTEWPVAYGAPTYVDANGKTIPGVKGADQTIWSVANDMNSTVSTYLYGAQPLGIEEQTTVWAYAQTGALGSMLFRKYIIINKSATEFDSMYVSQFSDIDDGNATDDFSGCDTMLSLGYTYNAEATDATYNPLPPPAVGFDFFQGPLVKGVAGQDVNKNGIDDAVDYGIRNGQKVGPGWINLPMTAFYYFANGDASVTDPTQGSIEGSTQFYRFFKGEIGKTGVSFTDPSGVPTPYALNGDPVTRKGWVDGQILPMGDRRMGLASGPFTMAVGDTQEIVVAEIAAGAIAGVDRLSAIGLLKFYDQQAQSAYDNNFDLPTPPPAPSVSVTELDREVILNWDQDTAAVRATESFSKKGHSFQGYNVYQLPSASASVTAGKRIATYDIVDGVGKIKDYYFNTTTGTVEYGVIQFGPDTGITRFFDVKNDELNGGTPLINGIKYYFAVTAYSYAPDAQVVTNLETPLSIITVIPHSNNPGVQLYTQTGTKSNTTHATGIADATVNYTVTDPTKVTGKTYTLGFATQPDQFSATYVPPDSALTNGDVTMTGTAVLNDAGTQLNYNVTITNTNNLTGPISSAYLQVGTTATKKNLNFTISTVLGKKIGVASGLWTSTDATQPFTGDAKTGLIAGNLSINVNTAQNPTGEISATYGISTYPWYLTRNGTKVLNYQQDLSLDNSYLSVDGIQVKIGNVTFAAPVTYFSATVTKQGNPKATDQLVFWGDYYTVFGGAPDGRSYELYPGGGSKATLTDLVQDIELRFTGVPSDAAHPNECVITSGGQLATIRSRSNGAAIRNVRIPFEVWETERNRQVNVSITDRNIDAASPWGDTGMPLFYRMSGRDYIVLIASAYGGDDTTKWASNHNLRTDDYATWLIIFKQQGASVWHTGDVFKLVYANPIVPGTDTWTFTTPSAQSYNDAKAKKDVDNINVWPNPYYGVNTQELNKYNRFVTFSHLPNTAKIRIFNLAGVLVKTIDHNSTSQFERWDLANQSGLPVASGLYIAYIDMPGLGTKTLKVAIIQEQQILDRF